MNYEPLSLRRRQPYPQNQPMMVSAETSENNGRIKIEKKKVRKDNPPLSSSNAVTNPGKKFSSPVSKVRRCT